MMGALKVKDQVTVEFEGSLSDELSRPGRRRPAP